jgi:hypothetical protein
MQFYTDESRESDPHALPDAETFNVPADVNDPEWPAEHGWYWWPCFPGCLPDGDPIGPFDTEAAAITDAREGVV